LEEIGVSFLTVVGLVIGGVIALFILLVVAERSKVNAMTPAERAQYQFGDTNARLVCPHCQTSGNVRAKSVARVSSTTGQIGGILKTNVQSTSTKLVTQHHCDHCSTTWDV